MQRILVGVDGSTPSRRALEWAADVARRTTLGLVAEVVIGSLEDGVGTGVDPAVEWSRQLEDWSAALPGPAHRETIVARGQPAAILLEEAAQPETSLLVVASRGTGEAAALHVGSVVRHLADRVTNPLAIVGPTTTVTTSRLVVGDHPTTSNPAALVFATELARRIAVPVTAVHARDPSSKMGADAETRSQQALAELHDWSEPLVKAGVDVDYDVEGTAGPDPVGALGHALRRHPGAVAVLGVHDPEGWGAGRVPLGLVRHSQHAVILVPESADVWRFDTEGGAPAV
jgi:nucleotide-binding universal stress UspA family protein